MASFVYVGSNVHRCTVADTVSYLSSMQKLPDGRVIPKDTIINFHPWCMGRDPDTYPDPLTVRPERWIPFEVKHFN